MVTDRAALLWTSLADALDIPKSLYEKAVQRHRGLGEWLCRPGSSLEHFRPSVRPQGSFRFGTVIRPMDPDAEYDLDHVVVLDGLSPGVVTQFDLKQLHGVEIAAYAAAHQMRPPVEHNRCWRARYRDEVAFHLDSLPCVPAAAETVGILRGAGVDEAFAMRAVAITDRRHPGYRVLSPDWPTSNPRGFARWFDGRASLGRDRRLLDRVRAGEVEDVPPYEWKTPLQRSIQLLKRHRDMMFADAADIAPISMIITNLAAQAYAGETDITAALRGIVYRMPDFVRPIAPRVPNPTHPEEDYADKWRRDPRLEGSFWTWHQQVKADIERLSSNLSRMTSPEIERTFGLPLSRELEARLAVGAPSVISSVAATTQIGTAPKPWSHRGPLNA